MRKKGSLRALFAAGFLFVMLAEWGSHSVICSEGSHSDATAMSIRETGHEDPCQTLALCSDGKQKDQQLPKLGHDATQHNGLLDVFAALEPKLLALNEPQLALAGVERLFRPPKPPYLPPKQA